MSIEGNRAVAHIAPIQCTTPSEAAAAALSVRERRRSFFFVHEAPRVAEAPQPVKAEEPKVVPSLPDSIYPAYSEPHCLKAQSVNGTIIPAEMMTQTRYSIEEIQKAMCFASGCQRSDMLSSRKKKVLVEPRQIAMTLCKMLTSRSMPEIGRRFGGRDHTTVLHATRKYEWMVAALKERVQEGSPATVYATTAWAIYCEREAEKTAA